MNDATLKRYDRFNMAMGVLQEETARLKDTLARMRKAGTNSDVKWVIPQLEKVLFDLEKQWARLASGVNKAAYGKILFRGPGDGS